MSVTSYSEDFFDEFDDSDDDLWFDPSEEIFEDDLDGKIDEKFDMIKVHAYVANPEENHHPELPTVVLQRKIAAFYLREPAPFEEGDPNLQKLFKIEEALQKLQENHAHQIEMEDRKFKSVIFRFDKTANRPYNPEAPCTYAELKKERKTYARRLDEVMRVQELMEREYRVEVKELESCADAIMAEWEAHQKFLAQISEGLRMEDRVRLGLLKQKRLLHYNFQMQEVITFQVNEMQLVMNEMEEMKEAKNQPPFVYHQVALEGEEQIIAEMGNNHGLPQENHQTGEALGPENVVVPNNQEESATHASYHREIEYEDDEGRLYALYSRDPMKRAFAKKKYHLDMEKRGLDHIKAMAAGDAYAGDKAFARKWAQEVGYPGNHGITNISEASTVADPNVGVKRTFSDFNEGEELEEQQGRKRLRSISVISRTPSPPPMIARLEKPTNNSSLTACESLGYHGYDGQYYRPDGQVQPQLVPTPSVVSAEISETPIYIDNNNGGPPIRRWTPPSSRQSSQHPSNKQPSGNRSKQTTSADRRPNHPMASGSITAPEALNYQASPVPLNEKPNHSRDSDILEDPLNPKPPQWNSGSPPDKPILIEVCRRWLQERQPTVGNDEEFITQNEGEYLEWLGLRTEDFI
ncbi:hypothetical protein NHQ30_004450 [Ciborinia camelliae]|nr:hypothetical protein NHQ30_004450 [Ciborinia camelliae]